MSLLKRSAGYGWYEKDKDHRYIGDFDCHDVLPCGVPGHMVCPLSSTRVIMDNEHAAVLDDAAACRRDPVDNTIHVINLDEAEDRWDHIQSLGLVKFTPKRFRAVKASPGWIGCAKSHVELVRMAKRDKMPYIIVAEDDFRPTISVGLWEKRLRQILVWLEDHPREWHVFNGSPLGPSYGYIERLHPNGLALVNGGQNTNFMIYNASSYGKIIEWDNTKWKNMLHGAIDLYISRTCDRMYTTVPAFTETAFEEDSYTDHADKSIPTGPSNFFTLSEQMYRRQTEFVQHNLALDPDSDVEVTMNGRDATWSSLFSSLKTFQMFNSYAVKRIIVYGLKRTVFDRLKMSFPSITDSRDTGSCRYVFLLNPSWTFCRSGFIELSRRVLACSDDIEYVWLASVTCMHGHDINKHSTLVGDVRLWRACPRKTFVDPPRLERTLKTKKQVVVAVVPGRHVVHATIPQK